MLLLSNSIMFSIILKIFFVQTTTLSSTGAYTDDEILNRFIDELAKKKNIQNWMEMKNYETLCDYDLFKDIVRKVSDILLVINTEKYADIKYLIMEKSRYIGETPYPYLKSLHIIESIRNILEINDMKNMLNLNPYNINGFYKNLLYEEYDKINKNIIGSVNNLGRQLNNNGAFTEFLLDFNLWVYLNYNSKLKTKAVSEFLKKIIDLIKSSNDKLECILPVDINMPVYVKAHSEGFKKSRKNSRDGITRFYKDGSTKIFTNKMLKSIKKCTEELTVPNEVNIEEYRNKTFVCNRSTANVLICLFHYYSEIKGMCTMYEVQLNENDEYQFKWSFYSLTPKERFKKKILKQAILDLSSKIIIHKFGLIVDFDIQYSTIKSDDTIGEPIETRLILLSCGHQLGLELIDEFFDHFYNFETKTSTCYICRQTVEIIRSYDAIVYRCK